MAEGAGLSDCRAGFLGLGAVDVSSRVIPSWGGDDAGGCRVHCRVCGRLCLPGRCRRHVLPIVATSMSSDTVQCPLGLGGQCPPQGRAPALVLPPVLTALGVRPNSFSQCHEAAQELKPAGWVRMSTCLLTGWVASSHPLCVSVSLFVKCPPSNKEVVLRLQGLRVYGAFRAAPGA